MALQKSFDRFGTTFTTAYHKIESLRVSKESVGITLHIYPNSSEMDLIGAFIYEMDYDPNGGEPLTQAYNYLKTLPEYSGATDV